MCSQQFLVLSDTHGDVPALTAVFNWAKEHALDTAVFLGDGIADLNRAEAATGFSPAWTIVHGNNDWGVTAPEAAVFDFAGRRFFLCHGHRYSLYGGFDTLIAAARNMQADAAFYGHTHVPACDYVNGLLLLNPGSVGRPRSKAGPTFAVIECLPGEDPQMKLWQIGPGKKIREWKHNFFNRPY